MKRKRESEKSDSQVQRNRKIRRLTRNDTLKRPEKRTSEDSKYLVEDLRRSKRRKYNYGETLLNDFSTQLEEYKRMKQYRFEESKVSIHDYRERLAALRQYQDVNNILRMCNNERQFRRDRTPPQSNHQSYGRVQQKEGNEVDSQFYQSMKEKCTDEDDCLTDITVRSYEEDVQMTVDGELNNEDEFPW